MLMATTDLIFFNLYSYQLPKNPDIFILRAAPSKCLDKDRSSPTQASDQRRFGGKRVPGEADDKTWIREDNFNFIRQNIEF